MPHVFWHVLILWHQNCVLQPDFAESVPVRTVLMTKRDKTQSEIEIGRQQFHGSAIWSGYEQRIRLRGCALCCLSSMNAGIVDYVILANMSGKPAHS